MTFEIPLRTVSTNHGNGREHWAKRARRVKAEREATRWAWTMAPKVRVQGQPMIPGAALRFELGRGLVVPLPCVVTLTRIAPCRLDGDNLQGALKAVRDEVACIVGVDDGDSRVEWRYGQERGPQPRYYAVRVEITGPSSGAVRP